MSGESNGRPLIRPVKASRTPRGSVPLLLACLPLSALALTLLLLPGPEFAVFYGRLLYPALSALLSSLTSWTLVPLGLGILPLASGIFLWRWLAPGRRLPLAHRLVGPLLLAVTLLALYIVLWGANYRRPPLLQLMDVPEQPVSQAEVNALSNDLLGWIRVAAAGMEGAVSQADAQVALSSVASEMERLTLELGWPARPPRRVKLLPPGTLLRSGFAGMLFPFTLEPQVDAGLSPVSRVGIGAHELAHAAGFAAEADADLAALLAGLRSPEPLARYATALSLQARMLGSLTPEQRSKIYARLPERAREDLAEARERSVRYLQASLAERVSAIYGRLLEGHGVDAGVADYQRAPQLAALLSRHGLLPPPPEFPGTGTADDESTGAPGGGAASAE